jgi:hypothetical protein
VVISGSNFTGASGVFFVSVRSRGVWARTVDWWLSRSRGGPHHVWQTP